MRTTALWYPDMVTRRESRFPALSTTKSAEVPIAKLRMNCLSSGQVFISIPFTETILSPV